MSNAIAADGGELARGLYHLLRNVDRSRFRDELEAGARRQLAELQGRARALLERFEAEREAPHLGSLAARLAKLVVQHQPGAPRPGDPKAEWLAFRRSVTPAYEALVSGLRAEAIHVPSLRPTNYARMAFHVAAAAFVFLLLEGLLDARECIVGSGAFAAVCWTLEASRRRSKSLNDRLMRFFRRISHPQEVHRVNSATWFATAIFLLALANEPFASAAGVAVLGIGDPAAAWVGRRYGRLGLVHGRTLEGTLTFVAAATPAAAAVLWLWHPEVSWPGGWAIALVAAITGALVELFSRRLDDNLTVPLAGAAGAAAAAWLLL